MNQSDEQHLATSPLSMERRSMLLLYIWGSLNAVPEVESFIPQTTLNLSSRRLQ